MIRFEIDEEIKHRLLGGHDEISITLQSVEAIDAYEEAHPALGRADDLPLAVAGRRHPRLGRGNLRPRLDAAAAVGRRRSSSGLALRGDETVLDAGCGTGRVTAMLLDRLPRGRVIAVDGSEAMVAEARSLLDPERTTVLQADLIELELDEHVDAVFSNAVFHWISDHARLFAALAGDARSGRQIEAQCGGAGNVSRFYGAVGEAIRAGASTSSDGFRPASLPGAGGDERGSSRAAGFEDIDCELEPRPARPPRTARVHSAASASAPTSSRCPLTAARSSPTR